MRKCCKKVAVVSRVDQLDLVFLLCIRDMVHGVSFQLDVFERVEGGLDGRLRLLCRFGFAELLEQFRKQVVCKLVFFEAYVA